MKTKSVIFACSIIIILSWALPLLSLLEHQMHRSYSSALGIAYGMTIGCAIHGVLLMVWFIIRRSNVKALELMILIGSFALLILLMATSDTSFS